MKFLFNYLVSLFRQKENFNKIRFRLDSLWFSSYYNHYSLPAFKNSLANLGFQLNLFLTHSRNRRNCNGKHLFYANCTPHAWLCKLEKSVKASDPITSQLKCQKCHKKSNRFAFLARDLYAIFTSRRRAHLTSLCDAIMRCPSKIATYRRLRLLFTTLSVNCGFVYRSLLRNMCSARLAENEKCWQS